MRGNDLYAHLRGIKCPWQVTDVDLLSSAGEVKVYVEPTVGVALTCPTYGVTCPGYDKRNKQ